MDTFTIVESNGVKEIYLKVRYTKFDVENMRKRLRKLAKAEVTDIKISSYLFLVDGSYKLAKAVRGTVV